LAQKSFLPLSSFGLVDAGLPCKLLLGQNRDNPTLLIYNGNTGLESNTDTIKLNSFKSYLQTDKNTQIYRGIEESNNLIVGFGGTWNCRLLYEI
jgi:hypothetical protein